MFHLILFGPPGSGKGTQAVRLAERFNLVHVSTGDLFRYEIKNQTPLGKKAKEYLDNGVLVPDEVTIGMLKNKMESTTGVDGFILDGFPRTIPQAQALDDLLCEEDQEVDATIALQVDDEEIVQRLLKRGETSGRSDDANEEVIRKRLNVYKEETAPVFDFYNAVGRAHIVDGIGSIDEIFERLSQKIEEIRG
jgi:adenylate kinase